MGKLVSNYQEVFERLSPHAKQVVRMDLIRQVQGTLVAVANQRYESLVAVAKLQSVLKQVIEQKQFFENRPEWGTW